MKKPMKKMPAMLMVLESVKTEKKDDQKYPKAMTMQQRAKAKKNGKVKSY